jgi:hypothetical protein
MTILLFQMEQHISVELLGGLRGDAFSIYLTRVRVKKAGGRNIPIAF